MNNNSYKKNINRPLVFGIVACSLLMNTLDSTIVATALHTIKEELNTSVSWVGWTLTAYAFGFVLMLPLSARLSIRYGHKRVFIASVLVFTIGSVLCGLSNNIYMLIVMRILQSVGGAGVTPSATGLIVDYFGDKKAQYLGLFGSFFATGALIGPIFGGIFVTYLSWQWIFFANLPFGIIAILMGLKFIPNDPKTKKSKHDKIDIAGLALLGTALLSTMFAATYIGNPDSLIQSFMFIFPFLLAIISFVLFFRHLGKSDSPFIQPRFIYGKGFGAVNLINILYTGVSIGGISLLPLYAVNRFGMSELNSGLLLTGEGTASVTLSVVMSILINRTGFRLPLYIGSVILSLGIALIGLNPQFGITPFFWLMTGTFLVGTGVGVMSPAARNAGIQLAPEQSASIAAVRSLGIQMGQIVTVAVTTAIIAGANESYTSQSIVYFCIAIILLTGIITIKNVPEHKGRW